MSKPYETPQPVVALRKTAWRLGVVLHPSRNVDVPLEALREWASKHGVGVVQVPVGVEQREVPEQGDAASCDLIVSIGGDGTTLAAIRVAAAADRPVLGVACGSLGVLTTVPAERIVQALERFDRREWRPSRLPALEAVREDGERLIAFNDIVIVRSGEGQIRVSTLVDGVLFGRLAGDGCIVSTPIGSSGYALAAGGPLLAPQADAFLWTPLSTHGGSCPSLVVQSESVLELHAIAGHGGARLEIDGQVADTRVGSLTITLRAGVATVVGFADQESLIASLRRRRIIMDSPRILAEEGSG